MKCKYNNNKNPSFKKLDNKTIDGDCELKYDPIHKIYKCGEYEYQDLLYPHPIIDEEQSKECIMENYNEHKSLIISILIIWILLFSGILSLTVSKISNYRGTFFMISNIVSSIYIYYYYYSESLFFTYDDFLHSIDDDNKKVIINKWRPLFVAMLFPVISFVLFYAIEIYD